MDQPEIRELHPGTGIVDAQTVSTHERNPVATDRGTHRPWIYTNMVASLDGGIARDGVSGGLGNDADAAILAALRGHSDAILVGSATVTAERYRPPSTARAAVRRARGQSDAPRLIVVSGRLNLDPRLPLFHPDDDRPLPLVITTHESLAGERAEGLAQVADLVAVGRTDASAPTEHSATGGTGITAEAIVEVLIDRGIGTCLLEGGATLNGLLAAADLIDEWNLTIAPTLIAASSGLRPTAGHLVAPGDSFDLAGLWLSGHHLFGRWLRKRR